MDHFNSFGSYIQFSLAREFVLSESGHSFPYQPNLTERLGSWLAAPIFRPGNFVLTNIRHPLMITALTISGIFLATLLFYPATVASLIVASGTVKLIAYSLTQITIVGVCLKTLGRLSNKELMKAWDADRLTPIPIGAVVIS